MKRLQFLAVGLFAAALGLVSTGCGNNSGVTIKLTDAPGDFKAAVVTISEVYLQGEGGRVVLSSEAKTTNLVTLANDTADLVKDAVVPEGKYSELRFVISGAYIEVENADGTTSIFATDANYSGLPAGAQVAGILQTPSFSSSGLKVKFDGDVEVAGEQKVILVDFDVAQSFGKEGGAGSDKWVMRPVIKGADITFSGSVNVTLTPASGVTLPVLDGSRLTLASFQATLTAETSTDGAADAAPEVISLTDANGDGVFEASFKFLVPGNYKIGFTAPAGVSFTTNPGVPAAVSIGSGTDQSQAFLLTSASISVK
jgi:hypothetical protein